MPSSKNAWPTSDIDTNVLALLTRTCDTHSQRAYAPHASLGVLAKRNVSHQRGTIGACDCHVLQDTMTEENQSLRQVSVDEILIAQREEHLKREEQEKLRNKILLDRGVETTLPVPTSSVHAHSLPHHGTPWHPFHARRYIHHMSAAFACFGTVALTFKLLITGAVRLVWHCLGVEQAFSQRHCLTTSTRDAIIYEAALPIEAMPGSIHASMRAPTLSFRAHPRENLVQLRVLTHIAAVDAMRSIATQHLSPNQCSMRCWDMCAQSATIGTNASN